MGVSADVSRLASAMACWNLMARPGHPPPGEFGQRAVTRQLDQLATVAYQRRLQALGGCFRRRASVPLSSHPIRRE